MKKMICLLFVSVMVGCGQMETSLSGQLTKDVSSITKAEISFRDSHGSMVIEYRKNSSWPTINTGIKVEQSGPGYKITKLDDKVELDFLSVDGFSDLFVCPECVTIYQGKLPLFWGRQ